MTSYIKANFIHSYSYQRYKHLIFSHILCLLNHNWKFNSPPEGVVKVRMVAMAFLSLTLILRLFGRTETRWVLAGAKPKR